MSMHGTYVFLLFFPFNQKERERQKGKRVRMILLITRISKNIMSNKSQLTVFAVVPDVDEPPLVETLFYKHIHDDTVISSR